MEYRKQTIIQQARQNTHKEAKTKEKKRLGFSNLSMSY
jgi:hypothetical protein